MTEEYGPPIAVNGKRPEWLGDDEQGSTQAQNPFGEWLPVEINAPPSKWAWRNIPFIRLRADHPYYQSAEYKASLGVGDAPSYTEAQAAVEFLEARGYTVTPPDPLAADREFLAGLQKTAFCLVYNSGEILSGELDGVIPAAMAYLRANKWRL